MALYYIFIGSKLTDCQFFCQIVCHCIDIQPYDLTQPDPQCTKKIVCVLALYYIFIGSKLTDCQIINFVVKLYAAI